MGLGLKAVAVTSCTGLPSRRHRRLSKTWGRVRVVQPPGAPHGPCPGPLPDKPADAAGYPLRHRLACGRDNQLVISPPFTYLKQPLPSGTSTYPREVSALIRRLFGHDRHCPIAGPDNRYPG
jgi:hypothetical protein